MLSVPSTVFVVTSTTAAVAVVIIFEAITIAIAAVTVTLSSRYCCCCCHCAFRCCRRAFHCCRCIAAAPFITAITIMLPSRHCFHRHAFCWCCCCRRCACHCCRHCCHCHLRCRHRRCIAVAPSITVAVVSPLRHHCHRCHCCRCCCRHRRHLCHHHRHCLHLCHHCPSPCSDINCTRMLSPVVVAMISPTLACLSPPTFAAPVTSWLLFVYPSSRWGGLGPSSAPPIQQTRPTPSHRHSKNLLPGLRSCDACDTCPCVRKWPFLAITRVRVVREWGSTRER